MDIKHSPNYYRESNVINHQLGYNPYLTISVNNNG